MSVFMALFLGSRGAGPRGTSADSVLSNAQPNTHPSHLRFLGYPCSWRLLWLELQADVFTLSTLSEPLFRLINRFSQSISNKEYFKGWSHDRRHARERGRSQEQGKLGGREGAEIAVPMRLRENVSTVRAILMVMW